MTNGYQTERGRRLAGRRAGRGGAVLVAVAVAATAYATVRTVGAAVMARRRGPRPDDPVPAWPRAIRLPDGRERRELHPVTFTAAGGTKTGRLVIRQHPGTKDETFTIEGVEV